MNYTISQFYKITAFFGLITPLTIFLGITLSIYFSPDFSWTNNYLSDLAGFSGDTPIWSANGFSSIIFNLTFILGGFFGTIFSLGLIKSRILIKCLCRTGSLFLVLNMIFLILIGIFPLTTGIFHIIVSYIFFTLVPLFLFSLGYNLRKTGEKKLGMASIVLGFITIFSFPLFPLSRPWGQNAIVEMFSLISISTFIIIFSLRLGMIHNSK